MQTSVKDVLIKYFKLVVKVLKVVYVQIRNEIILQPKVVFTFIFINN